MKRLVLGVLLVSASACDSVQCPAGTYRAGSTCLPSRDGGVDEDSFPDANAPDSDSGVGADSAADGDGGESAADGGEAEPACGSSLACTPRQQTTCTTQCGSEGTGTCSDSCAAPAAAECTAPDETCNGTDDDCDGLIDEGLRKVSPSRTSALAAPGVTINDATYVASVPKPDGGAWVLASTTSGATPAVRSLVFQEFDSFGGRLGARRVLSGQLLLGSDWYGDWAATLHFQDGDPAGSARLILRDRASFQTAAELVLPAPTESCKFARRSDFTLGISATGNPSAAWALYEFTTGIVNGACDLANPSSGTGRVVAQSIEYLGTGSWSPVRTSSALAVATMGPVPSGPAVAIEPWPCSGDGWAMLISDYTSNSLRRATADFSSITPVPGAPAVPGQSGGSFATTRTCDATDGGRAIYGARDGSSGLTTIADWTATTTTRWQWDIVDGRAENFASARLADGFVPMQAGFSGRVPRFAGAYSDGSVGVIFAEADGDIVRTPPIAAGDNAIGILLGAVAAGLGGVEVRGATAVDTGQAYLLVLGRGPGLPLATLDAFRAPGDTDHAVAVTYALGCAP